MTCPLHMAVVQGTVKKKIFVQTTDSHAPQLAPDNTWNLERNKKSKSAVINWEHLETSDEIIDMIGLSPPTRPPSQPNFGKQAFTNHLAKLAK